jgi:hypothetical protein
VVFSGVGTFASISDNPDETLKVWTVDPLAWQTPNGLLMVIPHQTAVTNAAFNMDGRWIATYVQSELAVFDTITGETVYILALEESVTDGCGGLTFLPDDQLLYAGCETVWALDIFAETRTELFTVPDAMIEDLLLNHRGDVLVLRADTGLTLYDMDAEAIRFMVGADARRVIFNPDGSILTILTPNGIEFWGVAP